MLLRRVLGWIVVALFGGTIVAATLADTLGIERIFGFSHMVAMRGWLLVGSLLVLVLLGAVYAGRALRRTHTTHSRAIAIVLALCLGFTAVANGIVLHARGFDSSRHVTLQALEGVAEDGDEITVIVLNSYRSAVPVEEVARLVRAADADVVFLPETRLEHVRDIAAELGDGWSVQPESKVDSRDTSILIAPDAGGYRTATFPMLGAVMTESADGGPGLIAAHPISIPAPLRPTSGVVAWQRQWAAEISEAYELCEFSPDAIIGGDFNSTADHGTMGCGYVDAAIEAGIGGMGTWPSSLPPALSAPIDRVFVHPDHWKVTAGWLVDIEPSDHRAVVIRLAPR